jgi:hypothetical protein
MPLWPEKPKDCNRSIALQMLVKIEMWQPVKHNRLTAFWNRLTVQAIDVENDDQIQVIDRFLHSRVVIGIARECFRSVDD